MYYYLINRNFVHIKVLMFRFSSFYNLYPFMIVFYFQVSVNFIGIFSDCGTDRNIHELPGNGKILGHILTMEGYTISNITAFCL